MERRLARYGATVRSIGLARGTRCGAGTHCGMPTGILVNTIPFLHLQRSIAATSGVSKYYAEQRRIEGRGGHFRGARKSLASTEK